ncbi:PaaX family transcriptional regulator [Streptomyces tendae]
MVEDHDGQAMALPRAQEGATPQRLLLTLFGDYFYGRTEPIPSATLVKLLGEFGITSSSARAALGRLGRRGLLTCVRSGRTTAYGLSEQAARIILEGSRRIFAFGTETRRWDGRWRIVVFSLPEEERQTRSRVRTRLRWDGWAPLYDGVWVSPLDMAAEIREVLDEFGVTMATVIEAPDQPFGPRHPLAAWDLDAIRQQYDTYVADLTDLSDRLSEGRIGTAEALVARTRAMDAWRELPNIDPGLPGELLPPDWPRAHARRLFETVYDGLGPIAELRFRQIVSEADEEVAKLSTHVRTSMFTQGRYRPAPGVERKTAAAERAERPGL